MTAEQPTRYVLYTYTGYESKLKRNLEHSVLTLGLTGRILRVEVPSAPPRPPRGAVFVQLLADDATYRAVMDTPGVTAAYPLDL
jgi:transcriptional antiterminator NusG